MVTPALGLSLRGGGEDKATIGGALVPYPHGPSQARGRERRPATFYTNQLPLREAKRLTPSASFSRLLLPPLSAALFSARRSCLRVSECPAFQEAGAVPSGRPSPL